MGEGHHPSLSDREMGERRADLIMEWERCVKKNEFVWHHYHDGRRGWKMGGKGDTWLRNWTERWRWRKGRKRRLVQSLVISDQLANIMTWKCFIETIVSQWTTFKGENSWVMTAECTLPLMVGYHFKLFNISAHTIPLEKAGQKI